MTLLQGYLFVRYFLTIIWLRIPTSLALFAFISNKRRVSPLPLLLLFDQVRYCMTTTGAVDPWVDLVNGTAATKLLMNADQIFYRYLKYSNIKSNKY
jgi:hypothetical protein